MERETQPSNETISCPHQEVLIFDLQDYMETNANLFYGVKRVNKCGTFTRVLFCGISVFCYFNIDEVVLNIGCDYWLRHGRRVTSSEVGLASKNPDFFKYSSPLFFSQFRETFVS